MNTETVRKKEIKFRSINREMTTRIIIISVITFMISIVLSLVIFVPFLTQNAIENSIKANDEVIEQLEKTMLFVESTTENLAVAVSESVEIQNYFANPSEQNENKATLMLNNLISREGVVRSVVIIPLNSPMLDSMNKLTDEDYFQLDTQWFKELQKNEFASGISPVYTARIGNTDHTTVAYVKNFYQNNTWFTFVSFVSLNSTISTIENIAQRNLGYFALADEQGNLFYTFGDDQLHEKAEQAAKSNQTESKTQKNGVYSFVSSSINYKLKIVSIVSQASMVQTLIPYISGVVVVLTLFLFLILVGTSQVLKQVTKPLLLLTNSMQNASKGNLSSHVNITSNNEVGLLGSSFNKMLDDLQRDIEIIAEKEKKQQQAKYSLLVSQIDPHFIHNTINSVNYLAKKGRCEDVISMNKALISILRDRLRVNDIQITDTIANEINVLNQYILIQKYMYEGDVEIIWDVDDNLKQEQIPKNMIQPLIENALFHGLMDEESGDFDGIIKIKIIKEEEDIKITVADNGKGMDEHVIKQVQNEQYSVEDRGKKIGLSNIRGRLYYLYGNRKRLEIKSEKNVGTTITLLL